MKSDHRSKFSNLSNWKEARVMLIGQTELEPARFFLRDATVQRRPLSDVFCYVVGEKLKSFLLSFSHIDKDNYFGFTPCCIVRHFNFC